MFMFTCNKFAAENLAFSSLFVCNWGGADGLLEKARSSQEVPVPVAAITQDKPVLDVSLTPSKKLARGIWLADFCPASKAPPSFIYMAVL